MRKWSRFSGYQVSGYNPDPDAPGKRRIVSDQANDRDPSLHNDYDGFEDWEDEPSAPAAAEGQADSTPAQGSVLSGASRRGRAQRRARRPIPWRWIGIAAASAVFIFSGIVLIQYYTEAARSNNASDALRAAYHQTTPAPLLDSFMPGEAQTDRPLVAAVTMPPEGSTYSIRRTRRSVYESNPTRSILSSFASLRRVNEDIVGWISFPGLVDEAVVQRDNIFYLDHDHMGNSNINGAIFADERISSVTPPENWLLYGHNMRTGAMFGKVTRYRTDGLEFMTSHAIGNFNTLYEDGQYVIFAVSIANIQRNHDAYLPYMQSLSFRTDTEFTQYIEDVRRLSLFNIPVDVAPGDELLTLCTCINGQDDSRLLVLFRRFRAGETADQLQQQVNASTIRLSYERSAAGGQ